MEGDKKAKGTINHCCRVKISGDRGVELSFIPMNGIPRWCFKHFLRISTTEVHSFLSQTVSYHVYGLSVENAFIEVFSSHYLERMHMGRSVDNSNVTIQPTGTGQYYS